MNKQHIGERMKAVTVYELMLMKERRDELETQRNELLEALKGLLENTWGYDARMKKREIAQAAVEKVEKG